MLHICIGVSAEYVKYSAVLINSIVKATQKPFDLKPYENNLSFTKDLKEGFCFNKQDKRALEVRRGVGPRRR